jgi:hypothetical protein
MLYIGNFPLFFYAIMNFSPPTFECLLHNIMHDDRTFFSLISTHQCMLYSGTSRNFEKEGPLPEIAKKSRILGLKSQVLLTLDGIFWAKRAGINLGFRGKYPFWRNWENQPGVWLPLQAPSRYRAEPFRGAKPPPPQPKLILTI